MADTAPADRAHSSSGSQHWRMHLREAHRRAAAVVRKASTPDLRAPRRKCRPARPPARAAPAAPAGSGGTAISFTGIRFGQEPHFESEPDPTRSPQRVQPAFHLIRLGSVPLRPLRALLDGTLAGM